jgi:hypothetical protein
MKKVDEIRFHLAQGVSPKDIAIRIPCSLSLVYAVRGRREMARLRHDMAELRLELAEIREHLIRLEGDPVDAFTRIFAQHRDR